MFDIIANQLMSPRPQTSFIYDDVYESTPRPVSGRKSYVVCLVHKETGEIKLFKRTDAAAFMRVNKTVITKLITKVRLKNPFDWDVRYATKEDLKRCPRFLFIPEHMEWYEPTKNTSH